MLKINNELVGKTVTFDLYPASVIGTNFDRVEVIGLGKHEMVTGLISPATMHASVYPLLPPGSPKDYRDYEYLMVKLPSGKLTAVGVPWIVPDSVTIVTRTDISITIHDASLSDVPLLKRILNENGYIDIDVSVK